MAGSQYARPGAWRLIIGPGTADADLAARGSMNMAVDETLLATVHHTRTPILRFYTWSTPCLSFGRNQLACGVYDPARAAALGVDVVRRPTGGLAVLHDRELTYCVLAPLAPLGGPRAAYAAVNRALVDGLRALGVPAGLAGAGRVRGPVRDSLEPCFQEPAAGEVVAGGRKLVGSAQRCERGALLQHGSILLSGSQSRVLDLLTAPSSGEMAGGRSTTLAALLGMEPPLPELVAALCGGFERVFGTRLARDALNCEERAGINRIAARYEAVEWTWRR